MKKLLVLMVALGLVFSLNSWVHADSAVIENPANGHKYQRIDSARTWHAAKSYCENQGKYLVTVTSSAENNFVFDSLLYDTVPTDENVYGWLGATDEAVEGKWEWVTGETWNYSNWIGIEPNNYGPGEHYLVYWRESGGWADYGPPLRPSVTLPFICEWVEGFVLTNTSDCEGAAGNVAVPQDIGRCEVKLNDVPLAPYSSRELKELDGISHNKESKSSINVHCLGGLRRWLDIMYSDRLQEKELFRLFILILFLEPSICDLSSSNSYQAVADYKISLGLQSGGGHFKPALDNLALDIETDTAKVSSVAQNDFAVGHNPDTTLTVAACYEGSVTVDPTNPVLSPVTLMKGQKVNVWSDRIGPITNIGQIMPGTNLLLLGDGAD